MKTTIIMIAIIGVVFLLNQQAQQDKAQLDVYNFCVALSKQDNPADFEQYMKNCLSGLTINK